MYGKYRTPLARLPEILSTTIKIRRNQEYMYGIKKKLLKIAKTLQEPYFRGVRSKVN